MTVDEAIENLRRKLKEKSQPGAYGTVSLEVGIQDGSVTTMKVTDTAVMKSKESR